jgi:soluble lytic murein transglycosylase-like protein
MQRKQKQKKQLNREGLSFGVRTFCVLALLAATDRGALLAAAVAPPTVPKAESLVVAPLQVQDSAPAVGKVSLESFSFPTERQILEQLGVKDREAFEQSADVLSAWARGKRFAAVERMCAKTLDPSTPDFPMSAFNLRCVPWWLESRSLARKKDAIKPAATAAREPLPMSPVLNSLADWQTMRDATYRDFLRRFRPKTKEQALRHVAFAMDPSVTCDFSVSLAAMIGRVEEFLPDRTVWNNLGKLYGKYAACERQDDEYREMVHLRTGLAAIYFGELKFAREALARALLAPAQEDRQRALFWLGLLEHTQTEDVELVSHFQNRHWSQLFAESPISIHAVIAAHFQGVDPYLSLTGDVAQPVAFRDGTAWSDFNLMALVSEVLIARGDAIPLRSWSQRIAKDWKESDPERQLFLGIVHNRAANYLLSIQVLTSYLKANAGKKLRVEFLKLLFPTPFSEKILDSSGGLDPLVVFALIRQESAFNPYARSTADARGLMQLLPGTARTMEQITDGELYEPRRNVALGTRYLKRLLGLNNNHLESVLAAYNAGQRHLQRWTTRFPGASDLLFSDLIPFRETRSYVSLIQRNTYWYGRLWVDRKEAYQPELITRLSQSNLRSRTVDGLLRRSWGAPAPELDALSLLANRINEGVAAQ